ncbi:MAG: hypothetical protein ACK4YP_04040 [Myxococcota bacterium]
MDLDPSATRRGPLQVVVALVLCTAIGAACGHLLITADWADTRKLLVGAALGLWCGLLLSTRRLMMM